MSVDSPGIVSRRWSSAAVVSLALLIALEMTKLVIFHLAGPAPRAYDAAGYWQLGRQVAGGDVWMTERAVAYRTPGYPWFLGLVQACAGRHAWGAVVGLQYVAVGLTTGLVGWGVWRTTQRPWCVVAALVVCLVSGARAGYASVLLTESLFALTLTAFGVLLSRPQAYSRPKSVLMIATAWAAAWLLRPIAVTLIPAWFVARIWSKPVDRDVRRWGRDLGFTVVVLGVALGPWVLRNQFVWNRPVLTVFTGRELWQAVYGPGQPGPPPQLDSPAARDIAARVSAAGEFTGWHGNWAVSNRLTASGLSDVEADDLMARVAWEGLRAAPARFGLRTVWRAANFWQVTYLRSLADYDQEFRAEALDDEQMVWGNERCRQLRRNWLDAAPEARNLVIELTSLLGLLGLAGLWLSPTTIRLAAVNTALVAGLWLATALLEYPSYRYRMVLEPTLIISGIAGGLVWREVIALGCRVLWENSRK